MLDCVHPGSSLSLRNFARLGSSLAFCGLARFGSSLAVLDVVQLGSALSLRSYARCGSGLAVPASPRNPLRRVRLNRGEKRVWGHYCLAK